MDQDSEKLILDYATPGGYRDSSAQRNALSAKRWTIFAAAIATMIGLILGDDIGSGRHIWNPITVVAAGVFLLAATAYMLLRIDEDERMPGWCKVLMGLAVVPCVPAVVVAYASWNRRHCIPASSQAAFWPAVYCIGVCVALFALARVLGRLWPPQHLKAASIAAAYAACHQHPVSLER